MFLFSGLAAEVICSENTTIKPDPSMIDNWEQQMYFVVTSHSGVERKYMYIPSRSYFSAEGIIMLNTQGRLMLLVRRGILVLMAVLLSGVR